MFKKLFKDKPIGFYFSLAASVLSLFMTIFYAAYMGANELFNAGVFILYLCAFLLPLVYFFVKENAITRIIPLLQAAFLALAFGITIVAVGTILVYYMNGNESLISSSASGGVLIFELVFTVIAMVVALVASFMRQTKKLTAEQQAEVDEDWANFKTNTKEFAVKHKTPLIIGGAGAVVLIAFIIVLFAVIIPAALVVHVDTVTFEQTEIELYETETERLTAVVAPEDAENRKVVYSSSNPEVATVTANGVVEAVKAGDTVITAKAEDGEAAATCMVTVKELKVENTEIAKMPNTVHYLYGQNEEFSSSGISIVATLSNGKTQKITKGKHDLTFTADEKYMKDGEIIVSDKKVTVTATYTFRDKTYSYSFDVYGDAAEASTVDEFETAYDRNEIDYIRLTEDLSFDGTATFDRSIVVGGSISAGAVSVAKDVTLTLDDGRITSGGDLTVSGEGKVVATTWSPSSGDRATYAAVYANGKLTINGADVDCKGMYTTGNIDVKGGAAVTVYGDRSVTSNGAFNGVQSNGNSLTVSGKGTEFNVLYDDTAFGNSPAALEVSKIFVDGATFNVGSTEGSASWGYGVWFNGSDNKIVAENGALVTFDVRNDRLPGAGGLLNGGSVYVYGNEMLGEYQTSFNVIAVEGYDMPSGLVKEGSEYVRWVHSPEDVKAPEQNEGSVSDDPVISGETATVNTVTAFNKALENESVKTIVLEFTLTFDKLNVTRDISVKGSFRVSELTVSSGATLMMADGRIFSDGNIAISGGGTIIATAYAPASAERLDHAAIKAGGSLTINGVTVNCSNIATSGDITVTGGAEVTVLGKNAKGSGTSASGVNGVHVDGGNGTITVSGSGTKLEILFNAESCDNSPAAINTNVVVDGAELYVGSSENCASWTFGVWFDGTGQSITAKNGAKVTFDVDPPSGYGVFNNGKITVNDTSTFTVITNAAAQNDIVTGTVTWQTPEQASGENA